MGRPKKYQRDELIVEATELFHAHGYRGTSTAMLVEALGINRKSLYAEFGSKQGLFDACLERYDSEMVSRYFGPLEQPDAGLAEIDALFAGFGCSPEEARGRGCLMCNLATELDPGHPSGRFVARYLERASGAYRNALASAQATGAVRGDVDVRGEAAALTAATLGLLVMLRAGAPGALVSDASDAGRRRLDALRPTAGV